MELTFIPLWVVLIFILHTLTKIHDTLKLTHQRIEWIQKDVQSAWEQMKNG